MNNISLNQQWKQSGTTLSYKEWRKREDEKMKSFDGPVNTTILPIDSASVLKQGQENLAKASGFKTQISNKTVFGIPKPIIFIGAAIIVGAIGYAIYKKSKS